MKEEPTYLQPIAQLLANWMRVKPYASPQQTKDAILRLMPTNGNKFADKLLSMAKKILKSNKPKSGRRRKRKAKKKVDEKRNSKKIVSALIKQADKIWSADLATMPYHDFLDTPYWKLIREIKLHQGRFHCSRCETTQLLQTHHTTYAHRGIEHKHLWDLKILCDTCHKKTHKLI